LVDTEIVTKLGIGFVAKNPKEFIQQVSLLCQDVSILEKLRMNCKKEAPNFSWSYLGQKFDEYLLDNSIL
jgi:glycosyltransferase involved in cell wall biosynthesis